MSRSRETRAGGTASAQPVATRGRLDERQWRDVHRAARIARATGVTITVHGVVASTTPAGGQKAQSARLQRERLAAPQQPTQRAAGDSPPPLTRRQRRSAARLQEFQEKFRNVPPTASGESLESQAMEA